LKIFAISLFAALLISLCGCYYIFAPFSQPNPSPSGEPDREYIMVNQYIEKGEDWRQIVTDSEFQLGEFTPINIDGRDMTDVPFGTYPRIDGSTVMRPLGAEFFWQHLDVPNADIEWYFTEFSSTSNAYLNLIHQYQHESWLGGYRLGPKAVDLILVTEPSESDLALASEAGIELIAKPVCLDAFVFITHKDNPVVSLTVEQVQKIYSGEITNWSEVGGTELDITAYQRNPNSGSQTMMERNVMNGLSMIPPPLAREVFGMGILIESVAEYSNERFSIGYTFKYYIDRLYVNENIKVLEINGIAPTRENIRDKSYPFTAYYYAVYRAGDKDGVAGRFTEWILSEEGQRCVGQAGYIPLG
jgi:phosphate transport system substrate-binding protein